MLSAGRRPCCTVPHPHTNTHTSCKLRHSEQLASRLQAVSRMACLSPCFRRIRRAPMLPQVAFYRASSLPPSPPPLTLPPPHHPSICMSTSQGYAKPACTKANHGPNKQSSGTPSLSPSSGLPHTCVGVFFFFFFFVVPHHPLTIFPHRCEYCAVVFTFSSVNFTFASFSQHNNKTHQPTNGFPCKERLRAVEVEWR